MSKLKTAGPKTAPKQPTTPPARTLLEIAKSLGPPKAACFIDKLPPQAQQEFLELRKAYQAGKLPAHMSASRIYRDVISVQHPDAVSESTFRKWIERRDG